VPDALGRLLADAVDTTLANVGDDVRKALWRDR
jgi:hypothetical protein